MRTSITTLMSATFLQSFFTVSSTPALQELQLKQSWVALLLHVLQSASAPRFFACTQLVALTYVKSHALGGLQHPDSTGERLALANAEELGYLLLRLLQTRASERQLLIFSQLLLLLTWR